MENYNVMQIEKVANDFGWNREAVVNKKLSLQSKKTRLKAKKLSMSEAQFEAEWTNLVQSIDILNQVINLIDPKEKNVTDYEQADVDKLDFDQTMKAIASIQSATCRNQFLTADIADNAKWQKYKKIEQMLLEHKKLVKPVEDAYIRKTELEAVINAIKTAPDASLATVVEMLEGLLK